MHQGWFGRWSLRVAVVSTAVFLGTYTAMVAAPPTADAAPAPSTTTLTAPASVTLGSPVTLTATVLCAAVATSDGTVSFSEGENPVGSGQVSGGVASASVSGLSAGEHTFTATFGGDASCAPSTSSDVTVHVVIPTTTAVQVDTATPTAGQAIPVSASVTSGSGAPAGPVAFLVDGTQQATGSLDGSGHTSAVVTASTAGAHTIRAAYAGQGDFAGSAGSVIVTVAEAPVLIPPTVITNEPPDIDGAASVTNEPSPPARSPGAAPAASSQLPNTGPTSGAQLPFTGSSSLPLLLLGLGSVVAGCVALRWARRVPADVSS